MEVKPDGTKHFNEAAAKLTHDRLISIYKTAGGYAHTSNPYKANVTELESQKRMKARPTLVKELAFLKSVIWEHVKIGLTWAPGADPTQLDSGETAWLVWFGVVGTDQVRMSLATAV